jgi:hypothetical protein
LKHNLHFSFVNLTFSIINNRLANLLIHQPIISPSGPGQAPRYRQSFADCCDDASDSPNRIGIGGKFTLSSNFSLTEFSNSKKDFRAGSWQISRPTLRPAPR